MPCYGAQSPEAARVSPDRPGDVTDSESVAESTDSPEEGVSTTYPTHGQTGKTKVGEKTGGKAKAKSKHLIAPLREVRAPSGNPAGVKMPFSSKDLDSWREEAKHFREDPNRIARRFELIVKNQDVDWVDTQLMLSELTETL
ncbi:hypothetical protein WISP_03208 [Willisornis vidua]|uniref:Uncharacterized protein n=1 Tax=Willisornis vidua TaxID=1566151 RepID=A0ABQ9DV04_9PASS|nr:hypothetical protein WISP_03208 [Willisornis vidua]